MELSNKQHGVDEHSWRAIPSGPAPFLTKPRARAWALVLDSRAIPCCIEPDGAGWLLMVPEQHLASALREVQLYEEANQDWPPAPPAARQLTDNTLPTVSVLLLVAVLHNLTLMAPDLYDLGAAHAAAIRDGQWWRCVTSLTLHADLAHLLSNLTIGGVFILLLCRELGSGMAWSLLLGAGAAGNMVNAWVQSPAHRSVGASTAVFGAVGLLAAISMVRYRHHLQRRWFVPVAAGLALLAILGTEGKQTDLGAHLFGFSAGLFFGSIAEFCAGKYGRPAGAGNVFLASLSAVLVAASWWTAIMTAG